MPPLNGYSSEADADLASFKGLPPSSEMLSINSKGYFIPRIFGESTKHSTGSTIGVDKL
jgi:hypothetical protein